MSKAGRFVRALKNLTEVNPNHSSTYVLPGTLRAPANHAEYSVPENGPNKAEALNKHSKYRYSDRERPIKSVTFVFTVGGGPKVPVGTPGFFMKDSQLPASFFESIGITEEKASTPIEAGESVLSVDAENPYLEYNF